jgi:hypothetical protein
MDSGILMIQDSILVCSPDPRIPHTAHGHYRAGCADYNFGTHITIGSRSFNPAYGYDIYEYKKIIEGKKTTSKLNR